MKVLVIVNGYPNLNGGVASMFVHVRNKYYVKQNIDVTVIDFSNNRNYVIDGVNVITMEYYYNQSSNNYDLLLLHAPNLRHHFLFLLRNKNNFSKFVFFFHGHEVLDLNMIYPKPFSYSKNNKLSYKIFQKIYDVLKLKIWRFYFRNVIEKSHFIFVSNWLKDEFLKSVKITLEELKGKYSVIHNSVGEIFEKEDYAIFSEKKYDFISIRSDFDGAKYGVDIVNNLAKSNPKLKFLLIGNGDYFEHYTKSDNLDIIYEKMSHSQMLEYINISKCGLLPTRQDTQGVMTCELAVYGIPVITSDLAVCYEILHEFNNVRYISNHDTDVDLSNYLNELTTGIPYSKNTSYFANNTTQREINLITQLIHSENK